MSRGIGFHRAKIKLDSIIGNLIGPGHVPEIGQDRPAQDTDVATAALEAKMVRNHRFFNRKFNRTRTRARTRPGQARPGGGGGAAKAQKGLAGVSLDMASLLKLIREHN